MKKTKEELIILTYNFFMALGLFSGVKIFEESISLYSSQCYLHAFNTFLFSVNILTLATWLIFTTIIKAIKPYLVFIESYLLLLIEVYEQNQDLLEKSVKDIK